MKNYKIIIHNRVFSMIDDIQSFIIKQGNYETAAKYSEKLFAEIESLSNPIFVNAIQLSQWQAAKKYHPKAKRLITKNRKWNIIFHTGQKYVYIDAIIPASLMK